MTEIGAAFATAVYVNRVIKPQNTVQAYLRNILNTPKLILHIVVIDQAIPMPTGLTRALKPMTVVKGIGLKPEL